MGSFIQRDNGIWYGVFPLEGRRVWRSMGTRDQDEARRRFDAMAPRYTSRQRMTVLDLKVELVEKILPGDVSDPTIRLYEQALRKFV
jgi:hypothetical protein